MSDNELHYRLTMNEIPSDNPRNLIGQPDSGNQDAETRAAIHEAEKHLRLGDPLIAYNALQQALESSPGNVRLRQLKGLALARSGALRRANEQLAALHDEGHTDGETMGLLARTYKDLALESTDRETREANLAAALEIYQSGYLEACRHDAVDDAYYTGINAATMALLRGDTDRARALATDVEALCKRALDEHGEDAAGAYWPQATLAEAALIRGDLDAAGDRYAVAAGLAGMRLGDLSSTRHQARMLLEHLGKSTDWLDSVMRMPPVLVFTGHMIDAPDRPRPRFPAEMEGEIRAKILSRLERLKPAAAYGSAACGADILCLECVREVGGDLHIVLPFPAERFRAESVDLIPGGNWGERFEQLLECAEEVFVISEQPPPRGESSFEYANLIMTGLARLRAQMLDSRLQGLAVWDGKGAAGVGGTGSVVDLWQRHGVPLEHVALPREDEGSKAVGERLAQSTLSPRGERLDYTYEIKTMLFADAVGYSKLTEEQIRLFFQHYLGAIADYNARGGCNAELIQTAGDGMYMVFDDPGDAGEYALGLSELIASRDWQALGLPEDLSARIGLHCGPVFIGTDPITGLPLYSGSHTIRTARIEPITPPGQVYGSGAFAAVAAARAIAGLRFSYVGRTQLAKQYGALALYHVRRC